MVCIPYMYDIGTDEITLFQCCSSPYYVHIYEECTAWGVPNIFAYTRGEECMPKVVSVGVHRQFDFSLCILFRLKRVGCARSNQIRTGKNSLTVLK